MSIGKRVVPHAAVKRSGRLVEGRGPACRFVAAPDFGLLGRTGDGGPPGGEESGTVGAAVVCAGDIFDEVDHAGRHGDFAVFQSDPVAVSSVAVVADGLSAFRPGLADFFLVAGAAAGGVVHGVGADRKPLGVRSARHFVRRTLEEFQGDEVLLVFAGRDAMRPDIEIAVGRVSQDEAFPQGTVVAAARLRRGDAFRVTGVLEGADHQLLHVAGAKGGVCGAFRGLERGEKKRREDRDDGDHDQEFDQREGPERAKNVASCAFHGDVTSVFFSCF